MTDMRTDDRLGAGSRPVPPPPIDHREAWSLLPWLTTDRLGQRERDGVLDHLKVCGVCREELRFLPELAALAEDAEDLLSPARMETNLRRLHRRMDRGEVRPGWRTALLAAAVLLVAGFAAVLLRGAADPVRAPHQRPVFRTLSDPPAGNLPVEGDLVRVVFDPTADLAAVESILLEEDLVVVAGPTPRGVWTLAPAGRDVDTAVDGLRLRPEVRLAERVSNPDVSPPEDP